MLQAINLGVIYRSRKIETPVLRGIDLDLPTGSFTAVMGPSGSGKTTLLYCLSGMLTPTTGEVLFNGKNILSRGPKELDKLRRTSFGFIFQSYNLIYALTALQNVSLPSLFGGLSISQDDALAALKFVGIGEIANRYPDEISGGQRQRIAIARALAAKRQVVFADEPTGALDSATGKDVMVQLAHIAETGSSIVLVTHDPHVAAYATRVVFLYDGRIVDSMYTPTAREIGLRLAALGAE